MKFNSSETCMDTTEWKNLQVGDIVKVNKNEVVPADILILKTSLENGFCYLQTSNLDGESALKPREALIKTNSLIDHRKIEESISKIQGYIEIDQPNEDIHFVEGTVFLDNTEKSAFNINNILLRVTFSLF